MKAIIRWIRGTITAKQELWEMHWRHHHHDESYGDISHDIAMRYMRKREGVP